MMPIAQRGSRSMRRGKESSRSGADDPDSAVLPQKPYGRLARAFFGGRGEMREEQTREELLEIDGARPVVNQLHRPLGIVRAGLVTVRWRLTQATSVVAQQSVARADAAYRERHESVEP
jgi:hypothetical protein